ASVWRCRPERLSYRLRRLLSHEPRILSAASETLLSPASFLSRRPPPPRLRVQGAASARREGRAPERLAPQGPVPQPVPRSAWCRAVEGESGLGWASAG